ncbi:uncharacterized protein PHALS_12789 [Plasmopara halstedii]|uniref:Uncharacterized protein n=1 Tax=Plasmopara halstedii TaxID=4781 RepID=A0A0P1ANF5_PLAHL|nr:uncharacterized protein PHALS_12789 [Plasmopara halstedii]CEG42521.1 hypothetical protein PHALS_12789 [Plasmopara halstedii]|eukprot:XP_024578890.1 hypothetical protein PHALS_12789 [Plasmopara halstedii]
MVNKKIYTIPQLLAGWTGCSMTVIRVTQGEKTRTPTNRELIFIFHFVLGRFKHHACSSRNRLYLSTRSSLKMACRRMTYDFSLLVV